MNDAAVIGIGIDYANARQYPVVGGADGLIERYRQRLSHVQVYSMKDDDEVVRIRNLLDGVPAVHHLVSIDPVRVEGPNLAKFERQARHSELLGAVWHYEDLGYWYLGPYAAPYFAPPILEREVASSTAANIRRLNQMCDITFMPENPTCTFTTGALPIGEFFTRVVDEADVPMVLDLSHLFSYAALWQLDPSELLRTFPLDRVRELHVAGGSIDPTEPRRYLDNHTDPVHARVFELLDEALECCPTAAAITFETSSKMDEAIFAADFERLHGIARARAFVGRLSS